MDGRICLGSAGYIVVVHNFRINQLAERARQRRLKAINLMVASRVGHAMQMRKWPEETSWAPKSGSQVNNVASCFSVVA